jgi:hypothetical protein
LLAVLSKWKKYQNIGTGEWLWPPRTQNAAAIGGLLLFLTICFAFDVTDTELTALFLGGVAMLAAAMWHRREKNRLALEREIHKRAQAWEAERDEKISLQRGIEDYDRICGEMETSRGAKKP